MNSTCFFSRWWVRSAILISGLCLLAVATLGCKQETKHDAKEVAKMVEDIVNRNKPPELVTRPPRSDPSLVPLYPESYDWKEEERVRQAIKKLEDDTTAEVWEEMVRRKDDPSYCVVVAVEPWENAKIYSVGYVCHKIAYSRLIGVIQQHMPDDPTGPDGRPLKVGVDGSLADFGKERRIKPLYQLQIEVGEKALLGLSRLNVENFPKDEVDRARKKIEAEIEKLRKTREPILVKAPSFPGPPGIPYPKDAAKRVRDAVKNGVAGSIVITGK
jgi:hypothetical protein